MAFDFLNFTNYFNPQSFYSNNNSWEPFPMPNWFSFNFLPTTNFNYNFSKTSVFNFTGLNVPKFEYSFAPLNFKNFDTVEFGEKNTELEGYNSALGSKIASIALENHTGFNKSCALKVNDALEDAGVSNGRGHAYQLIDILKQNSNFKQITPNGSLKDLPAGCVLVYDKGVAGYDENYGHVEITTGTGEAVSDGITYNLYKIPSAIFMPV